MGKKNEIKVKFNITIKSAFNLGGESDGKSYSIAWKRGSKSKNRGQTKKVDAKGGIASFGETFALVATMLQDEKSKKFDTKKLELVAKEDDKKKARDVGKLIIELGDYSSAGQHGPITLSLGDGDKKASKKASKDSSPRGGPSLKFDIEAEWTHFNKKKITNKKKEGKEGLEIDGVEYGLETDASDLSEDDATTLGDMSESESELESDEEEDSSADEGLQEMSAPVPSKRKGSNDDLKASSSSGSVPSKKALKEEKAKDKQVAKLEKEVSKLKEELAQAKDAMRDKSMKATGSQQELKQLKKELAEAKKHGGKGGGGDDDSSKELEEAKKTIKDLQDGLKKKESELKLTSTSFRELKESHGKEGKDADGLRKELQDKEAELKEKNRLFLQLKEDFEALKKTTEATGKKGDEADKLRKEVESLRRELEMAQKKSSSAGAAASSAGASAELEEELESTKKKLKKAKKETEEKEKRIDELQRLVAGKSAATNGAGEEVDSLKKQVAKQKDDIKSLNKENRERKEKIETLQQELERAKSGGGGSGSGSGDGGKEAEVMRKKIAGFIKEKEEDELIEREIYCMTTKYREGVHASAQSMCSVLMQWGVLDDPPNERLLSKILNAIKKGYKVATDDNAALVKWLSFATNLHEQLENEIGTSEDENSGDIPENGIHIFRDSGGGKANEDDDDPVSIFFHNLETIIFEIYSAFLKNIYAHIDDVIVPAILQPIAGRDRRGPSQRDARGAKSNGKNKSNALPSTGLTNILTEHLEMLHKYHLFESVIKQFFCQVFYYINTRLFNNLLKQEELCSCGSGFQIKLGLSQLEEWISKADKNDKKHLSQAAKRYLLHITEAANVLVVDKDIFTDEEMIENVFPTLTVPQIKYLLEHFQTDQYAPNPVPRNVMATLDGLARQRKGQKMLEVDEAYLLSLPKDKK